MRKFGILVIGAVVSTVVVASFIGVAPAGASTSSKALYNWSPRKRWGQADTNGADSSSMRVRLSRP